MRKTSIIDILLSEVDQSLRTIYAKAPTTERPNPTAMISTEETLTNAEKKRSAALMRINHAGEVSAQGLYRGQALTAKNDNTRQQMERSAMEENDHLNWCEQRIKQLNGHTSLLNPLWYWGSFSLGALAGTAGDKWSLGFVKETEDQVVKHIEQHLKKLPTNDLSSMAILLKMKEDEQHHAEVAAQAGSAKLPLIVRKIIMPLTSKIMTTISHKL
jgi:ubiquinone biosynthesis monooxygenase Coq7